MIVEEPKRPEIQLVYEGLVNKKVDRWLIPLLCVIMSLCFVGLPILVVVMEIIK